MEFFRIRPERERFPEFYEVLDRTSFARIEEAFREQFQDLGLDPDNVLIHPKEQVCAYLPPTPDFADHLVAGEYAGRDEPMRITPNKSWFETERKFVATVQSTIAHEQTHAVGSDTCLDTDEEIKHTVTGYHRLSNSDDGDNYRMFNEGITDMIAEEVYDYYQTRENPKMIGTYRKAYGLSRYVCQLIIKKLTTETELPETEIWSHIKRGYFLRQDMNDTKIGRLFTLYNDQSFFENLSSLGDSHLSWNRFRTLMKLRRTEWSDDDRKKVRRWLKQVERHFQES